MPGNKGKKRKKKEKKDGRISSTVITTGLCIEKFRTMYLEKCMIFLSYTIRQLMVSLSRIHNSSSTAL
jgi:hypothetical protein